MSLPGLRRAVLTLALAILAFGCAPSRALAPGGLDEGAAAPQPRTGGTLRVATLGGASRALHPFPEPQHNTSPRGNAAALMYANLIDVDWEALDFATDRRRSMARELPNVSPDGRVEGKGWYDTAENPEILKPTVVSGPYLLKEVTTERSSYARNPNWWGKQPYLDEIVFVHAPRPWWSYSAPSKRSGRRPCRRLSSPTSRTTRRSMPSRCPAPWGVPA